MLIRKGGASPHFKNFIWTDADGPEVSCELHLHNKMRTGRNGTR